MSLKRLRRVSRCGLSTGTPTLEIASRVLIHRCQTSPGFHHNTLTDPETPERRTTLVPVPSNRNTSSVFLRRGCL